MISESRGNGEDRWGAELDLGSRQSLDEEHGSATVGAAAERTRFLGHGGFWFNLGWNRAEGGEAQRQKFGSAAIGEEAEVADANEAFREQVQ